MGLAGPVVALDHSAARIVNGPGVPPLALLLAALVLLRALIPAGFMPDLSDAASGRFSILICTAAGTRALIADPTGAPKAPGDAEHASVVEGLCPFAAAGAMALAGLMVVLARPRRPLARALPPSSEAVAGRRYPAGSLGPRAPPLVRIIGPTQR